MKIKYLLLILNLPFILFILFTLFSPYVLHPLNVIETPLILLFYVPAIPLVIATSTFGALITSIIALVRHTGERNSNLAYLIIDAVVLVAMFLLFYNATPMF